MTEQKNTAPITSRDGIKRKIFSDVRKMFLQYCEDNQLNIAEASDILACLNRDLTKQVCRVTTRKNFDDKGNMIKYY